MALTTTATWHWQFDQPADAVWAIYADTARFNEAAGFPAHTIREEEQADGAVRYFGTGRIGSYTLEWEEIPTNWSQKLWFRHTRLFSRGPFAEITAYVQVESVGTGCVCHYQLTAIPNGWLGTLLLLTGFFKNSEKKFSAMAAQVRQRAADESELAFEFEAPVLAAGGAARAGKLGQQLAGSRYSPQLENHLLHWILERPEVDVWTIRPKALAQRWQVPPRHVIELCLAAVDAGMLSMRWDLLCPNCRVGKATTTTMDEIPKGAHCDSCNIDYQRNFSRNVELAFFPSKSIRPLSSGEYCLFGPGSTPHIQVQLRAEPGTMRIEQHRLEKGHYNIRTLEPGNSEDLLWNSDLFPCIEFDEAGTLKLNYSEVGPAQLQIKNRSGRARTVIIEFQAWKTNVLSAHEASTLQCFRELFSSQILRPGDLVEIDSVVLMFTDIKGSTALYNRIGDAAAYVLVREHFALLASCVREHNGTIVKTIGDAIMAAFAVPADGVRCSIAIQHTFADFNTTREHEEQVVVKIGMHMGPCISLTLNGIQDYYGKVANLTARIESLSQGGDVVISATLAEEPAITGLFQGLTLEAGTTRLKGFDEQIAYNRLSAGLLATLGGS